jgi:hypothetical protein
VSQWVSVRREGRRCPGLLLALIPLPSLPRGPLPPPTHSTSQRANAPMVLLSTARKAALRAPTLARSLATPSSANIGQTKVQMSAFDKGHSINYQRIEDNLQVVRSRSVHPPCPRACPSPPPRRPSPGAAHAASHPGTHAAATRALARHSHRTRKTPRLTTCVGTPHAASTARSRSRRRLSTATSTTRTRPTSARALPTSSSALTCVHSIPLTIPGGPPCR